MNTALKYIFILLLTTCSLNAAEAQQFLIGLKGGLQYYSNRFAEEETRARLDSEADFGYKFGGTIIFPLEENFSFGSEFYYSRKGRKYYYEETTLNESKYNFLEYSAYLRKSYKISFGEGKLPGSWFFNIGPNIMYWLSGSGAISDAAVLEYDVVFSEPEESDYSKNYIYDNNRWLFGLDFGAGVSIQTKKRQNITVELRYTHGHSYLGGENSSVINPLLGFEDDLRSQYRVLNLSIAYLFDVNLRDLRKGKSTIKRTNRRR